MRVSAVVLEAMQHWSDDELRSPNAQIEYVPRKAPRKADRLKAGPARLTRPTRPAADDHDAD
ncbi:hypothetical protein [Rhodanobacter thiooxydans]|uniref:hypothetical protein n=1 Tax=Rhodanobacter thiooxydans TaxID=416169 RepID=UPI000587F791|nr:hypothetical protein [Rhodanobacter thiooxydans]MCW0200634.1 Arc family DNA binding domain-containing protein [Rhodanobacter thiooxydans]